MKKKKILSLSLLCCLVLLGGCETTKGFSRDTGAGIGSTSSALEGVSVNIYKAIMGIDNWVKENVC